MNRYFKVFTSVMILFGPFASVQSLLPISKANNLSLYPFPNNGAVKKEPSLFVRYQTNNNNVLVECIISGISFRDTNSSQQQKVGKVNVYVDGSKKQVATAAAFIIKDLPIGEHKIKLEVVDINNRPYGLSKEFMVNISDN